MKEENIKAVEAYLFALRDKDLSRAPFADDIIFEDSIAGKHSGAENFRGFLANFLPIINDVKINRHVCEGDYVATHWEAHTQAGLIKIMEMFHVNDGKITEAVGYFDPRPLLQNQ